MNQIIEIKQGQNSYPVATIRRIFTDKKDKGAKLIKFHINDITWMLFRNDYYLENLEMEFPNEHYTNAQSVPAYYIHQAGSYTGKIGWAFPRLTSVEQHPYLYFHRTPSRKMPRPIPYYVFGSCIGKDYEIISNCNLLRML